MQALGDFSEFVIMMSKHETRMGTICWRVNAKEKQIHFKYYRYALLYTSIQSHTDTHMHAHTYIVIESIYLVNWVIIVFVVSELNNWKKSSACHSMVVSCWIRSGFRGKLSRVSRVLGECNPIYTAKCCFIFRKHGYVLSFHIIPRYWSIIGGWNSLQNKTPKTLFHTVNTIANNDLAVNPLRLWQM